MQWNTTENLVICATCFWTLYCPQQWPHMQQEPRTFQSSCSWPIPEDDNRAFWFAGLHLTLSRQWSTHTFTCTFQWCSSAFILITSTAPIPSVQTSSSFGYRTSFPCYSLCGSFLTCSISGSLPPHNLVHLTVLAAIWFPQFPHG